MPGAAGLAEAADENFVVHATWTTAQLAGAQVEAGPDLVVADSGLPSDTFNLACRARIPAGRVPGRIAAVIRHFRAAARPFSWWVGPADRPGDLGAHLVAAGLEPAESELAMAAELAALSSPGSPPRGLAVRRVASPDELRDYARVNAANWDPPDQDVLRFYEQAAAFVLRPGAPQWYFIGYCEGKAVATAELTVGGGVAGLYGVSTLASHRRRGFGTALTLRPLLDARAAGLTRAVLQASADGAPVYRRLGFEAFGAITEYKPRQG